MTQARSSFSGFRRWSLVILVLLSFALRIYNLAGLEFWFDEAISANIAGMGWRGAIEYLRSEPFEHPPLYYLSLNPWLRLVGTSEFALRFYSVIYGVLVVPLLYVLVRRLADPRLAWLSALLATLSPFMVAYAQEARMYTLMPLLALLVMLSFLHALETRRPAWWLAYAALIFVGVATHYYFALIWVATTTYLLLEWPRRGQMWRWGLAVQSVFFLAGVIWLVAASGPRSSLIRVLQGETAFGLAYKLDKVMPTLMLAEIRPAGTPGEGLILAIGAWLLLLIGVWASRRSSILKPGAWRLLMLWIVVPLVASLFIPYGVLGRHLGYTLIAGFAFMAYGLLALSRAGRRWLAVGIASVLLLVSYGLVAQYTLGKGDFGQAMAYVDDHAQTGDLLVLTQPAQQHLVDYYNREGWPVQFVPDKGVTLTPGLVQEEVTQLGQSHARLWLGPVGPWTADPDSLVEQWLAANAFQAEKTWFAESSSVALYFSPPAQLPSLAPGRPTWGGRIQLQNTYGGPLRLQPGDAVRLRFQWRAGYDLEVRYTVRLALVDGQGQTWAQRLSEPCGGRCLTDTWLASALYQDQHALLVPPGTPPGTYDLQIVWLPVDSADPLPAELDGRSLSAVTVAQVTVLPAQSSGLDPGSLPNPLQATFGGEVSLLGFEPASVETQPGATLHLETHWQAETAMADDLALLVELVDSRGRPSHVWPLASLAASYPTSRWQPGAYQRGQHELPLPSDLPPGRYQLRLSLLGPDGGRLALSGQRSRQVLGGLLTWQQRLAGDSLDLLAVDLRERPRRFDLPPVAHETKVTVGRQARLVGYDLVGVEAHPGDTVQLTLVWQADGPLTQAYKVFVHLLDESGTIRAQHDGPPGGGCCPTNTWAEGEVIVDEHPLVLGADLPAGTYQIVLGMYDEDTDLRLPAYAADGQQFVLDQVPVEQVAVVAVPATAQPGGTAVQPFPEFEHHVFLPVVGRGQP